jgi:hypothetical protein
LTDRGQSTVEFSRISERRLIIQTERPQRIFRRRFAQKLSKRSPCPLSHGKHVHNKPQLRVAGRHINNPPGIDNSNATAFTWNFKLNNIPR